jgi:hypothetical protein
MQFKAFAETRKQACALGKSRVRERSGLDSEDGNCGGRGLWRRVVDVFNPSGDSGGRVHQLGSSQPDHWHYYRMERYWLGVQRVIVDARRSLLAATMRRRHLHLPALVLHHAAAGALLSAHLRTRNHAGHCWSQAGYQQQDQHTELAENTHSCN